jgi:hypothetical protein
VLGGESETLVVGVYSFQRFYKVTGPWHALCCFATHVETKSPPNLATSRTCLAGSQI